MSPGSSVGALTESEILEGQQLLELEDQIVFHTLALEQAQLKKEALLIKRAARQREEVASEKESPAVKQARIEVMEHKSSLPIMNTSDPIHTNQSMDIGALDEFDTNDQTQNGMDFVAENSKSESSGALDKFDSNDKTQNGMDFVAENSRSESSEMDSDDSLFFTENRKRKKFTKKSWDSSKCKKMSVQQQVRPNIDVNLEASDTMERKQDENEESGQIVQMDLAARTDYSSASESSEIDSDDSNFFTDKRKKSQRSKKKGLESQSILQQPNVTTSKDSLDKDNLLDEIQDESENENSKESESNSDSKRPFKCKECQKAYTLKGNLTRHIKAFHKGEMPFSCDFCEQKFSQNAHLLSHRRRHMGEKPFGCSYCEKKFTKKEDFDSHMLIHTSKRHLGCDFCEKKFSQKEALIAHMRTHTGIKPFQCDICQKQFTRNSCLKRHQSLHEKNKQ